MLDILLFREEKGGNPELVRESQKRRFASVELVDEVITLDQEWRKARFQLDQNKKQFGIINKQIAAKKKARDDCVELIDQIQQLKITDKDLAAHEQTVFQNVQSKLKLIGNIVHASVPVSKDEANNELVKSVDIESKYNPTQKYHHHELLYMIDGYEPERGAKVAGHRGYFLKNNGVRLNMALYQFGLDFLAKRGYDIFQTPYFMKREVMALTAQLAEFDEELYKVTTRDSSDGAGEGTENPDKAKYLIATGEQPMTAYHLKEWIDDKLLPLKYAAFSTNFRKEAGAHGKDTWGIFRVHQFEKVEQFILCKPEESWAMHEEMLASSEAFMKELSIPYRVMLIVSGELNSATSKKYDVEGWFPGFNEYRELVSCSNCTDYQSRRLEVRCGLNKKGRSEKQYVHMLNSTLCATERTLCSLLENHQTDTGIMVPPCLQPYMGGLEEIPFVKNPPKKGKAPN